MATRRRGNLPERNGLFAATDFQSNIFGGVAHTPIMRCGEQ